jgi:hypothetical protein
MEGPDFSPAVIAAPYPLFAPPSKPVMRNSGSPGTVDLSCAKMST